MTSPSLSKPQTAKVGSFLRFLRRVVAHWRAIVLLLILACVAFLVARSEEFGRFELMLLALLLIFIASQIFWIGRLIDVEERFIPGRPRRAWLMIMTVVVYLFVFLYSYPEWGQGHVIRPDDYRPQSMLIHAAFWWWYVGSMAAFLLVIAFGAADRVARAAGSVYHKVRKATHQHSAADAVALLSPARRRFLERTAVLVSATPFVAAGYGLLYERQNVEVVRQRVRLARLPKAFEGFRIAQLSDIHLGPFTTADYIRRCVAITNGLGPDLIALTGDYICWDPKAQGEVVQVLASLRAPHGVFGCLGNHEADVGIEDSITRLFAAQGMRMLRQERVPIRLRDDTLNLIGIDDGGDQRRLQQLKALIMPNTVNILLIHYPQCFDQPELGIDLTLAGDVHGGGQLSLDFIHRGLNLGSLIGVPYIRGLYEGKHAVRPVIGGSDGAQLYMNRGIGITGFPIRIGARPEITELELTRET